MTDRLDPFARTTRDQGRRSHRVFVSQGAHLSIDAVSAGTSLVEELKRSTRSGKLACQLGNQGACALDRAIEYRRPAVLCDRHLDRILVYVHRHKSCRFTHSLLLLAGDRSLGGLTTIQR